LRDRTESALSSGALALARAEGAITIAAGQARVTNSMPGERGSELALIARINLAENDLDARLALSAAAGTGTPPELIVMLKGPVSAPKRSVDVAAFASWLALRAVEQQSKKLDVLEGREPSVPVTGAAVERPPERSAIDGSHVDGPPGANAAPTAGSEASRPRPPIRSVQKPKPSEPAHPALPSPLELLPRLFGVQ
jgi:hypothetical protein